MSGEFRYERPGVITGNYYAMLRRSSNNRAWKPASSAFVILSDAEWANCAITLNPVSGLTAAWEADGPTLTGTPQEQFQGHIFLRVGGSPNPATDSRVLIQSMNWNGSAWVSDQLTGYKLATDGLDLIAAPSDITSDADARSSLVKMIRALFNRSFNRVDKESLTSQTATMKLYNDSGTVILTMGANDNGSTATKSKSA